MPRLVNDKPHIPLALQNFDRLPDAAHVRVAVVSGLLGQSIPTTWRRVRNNDCFPQPRKLGPKVTGWNVGELRRYLAAGVPA